MCIRLHANVFMLHSSQKILQTHTYAQSSRIQHKKMFERERKKNMFADKFCIKKKEVREEVVSCCGKKLHVQFPKQGNKVFIKISSTLMSIIAIVYVDCTYLVSHYLVSLIINENLHENFIKLNYFCTWIVSWRVLCEMYKKIYDKARWIKKSFRDACDKVAWRYYYDTHALVLSVVCIYVTWGIWDSNLEF